MASRATDPAARLRRRTRAGALALAIALAFTACSQGEPRSHRTPRDRSSPDVTPTQDAVDGQLLLASSFEAPVCGGYHQPGPGCEFGVEGEVEAGPFDCRTGEGCVRIQRLNQESHMGVIALAPFPMGHAFVGSAQRVPATLQGVIPSDPGYIQLMQLSPTDGQLPAWPVEVRLFADRTLGLALFRGPEAASTTWRAPVDEWFYMVVEVSNGIGVPQRMWVYDASDQLVEKVVVRLDTSERWIHGNRSAHKIGGVVSTLQPMYTYADDWYISTESQGPLHIGADGEPLS